ncbi:hypothetical protein Aeh1ORF328c [Aeromonas phage Aeh1]|uniref:Uncharacterized protein n=1 Tax=Aeromonas phage Aeh1 TaxID=2880362 RepID=Q76Y97_9CAUD|nr:Ndd-like nucleoid disruption protein [Aeromonas phage Aeh1]AAQ17998.1 hypothetical protein Aeh1ORF328c [Aeromonas phage Aeh1]
MKNSMPIGAIGGRSTYIGSLFPNKDGIIEFKNCQSEKIGNVNHDLTTPGFYLIGVCHEASISVDVVSVNHVGIQKRKSGFKEVLSRLNNPRTEQNKALGDYLCKRSADIFNDQRIFRAIREVAARHKVYFMTYSQMREFLEIEEYSAKNNGLAMITELRTKYKFFGRQKS